MKTSRATLLGLLLSLGACSPTTVHDWPTQDWVSSSAEAEGMDSSLLRELLREINQEGAPLHSVVIVRHGRLVLDSYFEPYDEHHKHIIYSATKSLTTLLIGAAIDDGLISDEAVPVLDLLGGNLGPPIDSDNAIRSLELRHLLTMTAGFDWQDGPYGIRESGDFSRLLASQDGIAYILNKAIAAPPGSRFNYNSGGSHLLAAVIQEVTGRTALEYADARLFRPIGIRDAAWSKYQGINNGGSELFLRPKDMARLGYLVLRKGRWNGEQIVSEEWIDRLTEPRISTSFGGIEESYGYGWYTKTLAGQTVWSAEGLGGNGIYVVPEQDLVVVFTGGLVGREMLAPYRYLEQYILSSVRSDGPQPPNPESQTFLEAMQTQRRESESQHTGVTPNVPENVSGRAFVIDDLDNLLGIEELSFDLSHPSGRIRIAYSGTGKDEDWGVDVVYRTDDLVEQPRRVDLAFGLDGWPRTTVIDHDEVGDIPISASGRWEEGDRLVLKVVTGWAIPQTWTIDFSEDGAVSLAITSVFYDTTVSGRATAEPRTDDNKRKSGSPDERSGLEESHDD